MTTTDASGRNGKRVRVGSARTGAWLARYALEQLPVSHTFGIPGVHTTELYDEMSRSSKIRPVLVTHEVCGAFAADAISRTGGGRIGCLLVVPAAGLTHAMSGIGECFLDGIPLLVICGGTRTDIKFGFQLHGLDQRRLVGAVVKAAWTVSVQREVVPTIFEAYRVATSGVPGPVLVEIPVNVQLFKGPVGQVPVFEPGSPETAIAAEGLPATGSASGETVAATDIGRSIGEAARLLAAAEHPGIFAGWGAVDVAGTTARIAERLGAPVSTTLQGMSAFAGSHPLHAGMGFSRAAVPAAEHAFRDCDCLLAIGTSFAEIPTGSFGCRVPDHLIHIDISPQAIGRNYRAEVAIPADSRVAVPLLLEKLEETGVERPGRRAEVESMIAADKRSYREEWHNHRGRGVNPALFFEELRRQLSSSAIVTLDDGNHTFLAAELFEVREPRTFISPTDFNSMGYAVPAAIGAKLANPDRQVAGIVGDGAFLMTGMETITASTLHLGIAYFVFHDGELSQISQGQQVSYNRKSCTVLGRLRLSGIAEATGACYVRIDNNEAIPSGIRDALAAAARSEPAIVDVEVDYSKKTRFTQGVVKTVLGSFPAGERTRFVGRALSRKVTG
jgi:acetolactate synthase-1/2/3 large subunit